LLVLFLVLIQTDDTATTTVTVRNAAPSMVGDAKEAPASYSSNPVNVGGTLFFEANAHDPEGDEYYLLVCDQDGATAVEGGAPSCDNTQFCVSTSTASDATSTCVYSNVANPPLSAETQAWVAYVCDGNGLDAACESTSNSGSGNSGSPFHVNHAPVFSAVSTTLNSQVPGDFVTIEASVIDNDVDGSADELIIYVCDSNSWATSTGCAGAEYCTGTSTTDDVSCSYTIPVPTPDQSYVYYAFVMDWHDMPASGNSQTSNFIVANAAPTVSSVDLNEGNDIILNIKDASNVLVGATSTAVVDSNGCLDLDYATSTIYLSSVTGEYDCDADDNDCYPIGQASCAISGCSGAGDANAIVTCTTTLAYYAIPTDDASAGQNNPYALDNWVASIRVFDDNSLSGVGTSSSGVASPDVVVSTAIEVSEPEIVYGSLIAGTNTGATNGTTTIVNAGNAPLDTDVEGVDMDRDGGGGTIDEHYQEFDLSSFVYGAGTYTLSSTTPEQVNTIIPRPTGTNSTDDIYWGIGVPVIISGDYAGLNTFSARLDDEAGEW